MRLAKFLAVAGVASRRASEQLVRSGRVTVDGVVTADPARDVGDGDAVAVGGVPVTPVTETVVFALNKPSGVVSTVSDPQGRPTVVSLLDGVDGRRRLYPVGRLDIDTTGLILLTNDGDLAYRLTHPSFEVPKTYRATVSGGPVRDRALRELRAGVRLEDGFTAPARVRRLRPDTLEITIHEGRNRQVKRMCEAVGHRVIALERTAFGSLELGRLAPGAYRRLTAKEVEALLSAGTATRRSGTRSRSGRVGAPDR
jgi:23S rRNA pseudouridine2605 synthase